MNKKTTILFSAMLVCALIIWIADRHGDWGDFGMGMAVGIIIAWLITWLSQRVGSTRN